MARFDNSEKNEVREEVIQHAINALTIDRKTSSIFREGDFTAVWEDIKSSFGDLDEPSIESIKEEVKKLEKMIIDDDANPGKSAKDLKVIYLAGENPLNDFKVFVKYGIDPKNITAIEKDPTALEKGIDSIRSSEYEGKVNIFHGSFKNFCEEHPEKFDLIYYDTCSTVTSQASLQDISTIFEQKKLPSLGVLITNFSFPPKNGKDATEEKNIAKEKIKIMAQLTPYLVCRFHNLNKEYIKDNFVNNNPIDVCKSKPTDHDETTSHNHPDKKYGHNNPAQGLSLQPPSIDDMSHEFEDFIKNRRSVEENYGEFIIFLIWDLASIFKPALRMFKSFDTCKKNDKGIWHQIGLNKEHVPEHSGEMSQKQEGDNVFQDQLLCVLMPKGEKPPLKPLTKAIFSDSMQFDQSLSKFLGVFCTWFRIFHLEYCNKFVIKNMVEPFLEPHSKKLSMDNLHLIQLLFSVYYGKYARPSFPVLDKHLSLKYTGSRRQMFTDVFVFDECRLFFDYVGSVPCIEDIVTQPLKLIVVRIIAECMRRKLGLINEELNQTYSSVLTEKLLPNAFSTLPERTEIKMTNDVSKGFALQSNPISQPKVPPKSPEEHEEKHMPLENKSLHVTEDRTKMETANKDISEVLELQCHPSFTLLKVPEKSQKIPEVTDDEFIMHHGYFPGLPLGQDAEYNKQLHHASNKNLLCSATTISPEITSCGRNMKGQSEPSYMPLGTDNVQVTGITSAVSTDNEENTQSEELLCRNLTSMNLSIDPVARDGNCAFASIIKQVHKLKEEETVKNHLTELGLGQSFDDDVYKLRQIFVSEVQSSEYYQQLLGLDQQVRNYETERFRLDGIFDGKMGDIIMRVCSNVLKIPIQLITNHPWSPYIQYTPQQQITTETLCLYYDADGPGHYDSTLIFNDEENANEAASSSEGKMVSSCGRNMKGQSESSNRPFDTDNVRAGCKCPCAIEGSPCKGSQNIDNKSTDTDEAGKGSSPTYSVWTEPETCMLFTVIKTIMSSSLPLSAVNVSLLYNYVAQSNVCKENELSVRGKEAYQIEEKLAQIEGKRMVLLVKTQ